MSSPWRRTSLKTEESNTLFNTKCIFFVVGKRQSEGDVDSENSRSIITDLWLPRQNKFNGNVHLFTKSNENKVGLN